MASFILSAFADEAASSLDGQISALLANGIYHIEPRNIDGRGILDYSEEELKKIKEKLDAASIKVNSIGSPIGKYNIEDPDQRSNLDLLHWEHRVLATDHQYCRGPGVGTAYMPMNGAWNLLSSGSASCICGGGAVGCTQALNQPSVLML